jgi:pimeloyl-ACP methyl ester carboxylesterase
MHRPSFHLYQRVGIFAVALSALFACGSTPPGAPAPDVVTESGTGYNHSGSWLCRPGREDACVVDLSSTIIRPTGNSSAEAWRANPDAPIDCFYVYPTVSMDATGNSDMSAGPEERRAVQHQFARFGSECRLFAPVYRQITVPALRSRLMGASMEMDPQLAYADVVAAWNHYLKHDNKGRGVVLIGHSQGARMLSELLAREIEGKPVQKRIVSALLIGTNITVPKGKDVGGSFRHMPLCRSAGQTGCMISYVSFRADSPPPANSLFGLADSDSMVACTNPAALEGGSGELDSYLPTAVNLLGQPLTRDPWARQVQDIKTPFVSVPRLLSAQCASSDNASYLAVKVQAVQGSPGVDIAGDLIVGGKVLQNWGLHLIDMDLAMGNLIRIVRRQAQAHTASAS